MKKLILIIMLIALLLACALAEEADVHISGDWKYIILEDGSAQISDYTGRDEELIIPATIDGYAVTSIGDEAFSHCRSLSGITIPDGIISMGENPFLKCEKLKNIWVSPDHPVFATIEGVLFYKPEKKLITYPCGLSNSTYSIPQGIISIGDEAFYACTSLSSISIPDSVTNIGRNPFYGCDNLENISVSPENPALAIIDGGLIYKPEQKLIVYSRALSNASYSIPQGITTIGFGAFSGSKSLCSILIPNGVTTIEKGAFAFCESLDSISIPNSVITIGEFAFIQCARLSSITILDGITAIEEYTFSGCESLRSISIPDSVTIIGNSAFSGCISLSSISIPDSVTTIEGYAFSNCDSLRSITIPDSVTFIGNGAFSDCDSLTTITVGRDSYAAQWCKENGLNYTYPDSLDWLNG